MSNCCCRCNRHCCCNNNNNVRGFNQCGFGGFPIILILLLFGFGGLGCGGLGCGGLGGFGLF